MRTLTSLLLLLILPYCSYARTFIATPEQCDTVVATAMADSNRTKACAQMQWAMNLLGKDGQPVGARECLKKMEASYSVNCGVPVVAKNAGAVGGVKGKEQIYVALYRRAAEGGLTEFLIERASTFEAAAAKNNGGQLLNLKRLDDDKCKKGYYILGMNNKDETDTGRRGGTPVAGFLNCGYKSLDDAIDRGTRDFPIPFFNIAVGSVASSELDENENLPFIMACGYDPNSRDWGGPAYFGQGNYGYSTRSRAPCRTLNGRYPILVDREPEQTIWVSPR